MTLTHNQQELARVLSFISIVSGSTAQGFIVGLELAAQHPELAIALVKTIQESCEGYGISRDTLQSVISTIACNIEMEAVQ